MLVMIYQLNTELDAFKCGLYQRQVLDLFAVFFVRFLVLGFVSFFFDFRASLNPF